MNVYDKIMQAIEWELEDIPAAIAKNLAGGPEKLSLLPSNYESLIKAHLKLGFLDWKKGINPTQHFKNAVAVYRDRQTLMEANNLITNNLTSTFYFAAYLIDEPDIELPPLHEETPKFEYLALTRFLLEKIWPGTCSPEIIESTEEIFKRAKVGLLTQTFVDYLKLFEADDASKIESIVSKCEKNYKSRRTNRVFGSFPSYDGGGPSNNLFVDYWLAASLKKLNVATDSDHKWGWD